MSCIIDSRDRYPSWVSICRIHQVEPDSVEHVTQDLGTCMDGHPPRVLTELRHILTNTTVVIEPGGYDRSGMKQINMTW